MQNNYHATTSGLGMDLELQEAKATSQGMIILGIFLINNRPMTANDVHTQWSQRKQDIGQATPLLTSVRRAISNLKSDGHLDKKTAVKKGPYSVNTHYYSLTPKGKKYAIGLVPTFGNILKGAFDRLRLTLEEPKVKDVDPMQLDLFGSPAFAELSDHSTQAPGGGIGLRHLDKLGAGGAQADSSFEN